MEPDKILLPEITYQGNDKKLMERITKFKAGTFRIVVFTIIGLIMGLYSHNYVSDTFFPTKLITAVPYKITETIYVFLIGTDAPGRWDSYYFGWLTEFFPHSMLATLIAETVTTMLIGGAIYGSLAYFTGDKRVFTLSRFLKFFLCWCTVITLCIGAAYAVNAKAVADNEALRRTERISFFLYNEHGGSSTGDNALSRTLADSFFDDLKPVTVTRDLEKESKVGVYYGYFRYGLYSVNYEKQYLATEQGKTWSLSPEFAQVIKEFIEENKFPDGSIFTGEATEMTEVEK